MYDIIVYRHSHKSIWKQLQNYTFFSGGGSNRPFLLDVQGFHIDISRFLSKDNSYLQLGGARFLIEKAGFWNVVGNGISKLSGILF